MKDERVSIPPKNWDKKSHKTFSNDTAVTYLYLVWKVGIQSETFYAYELKNENVRYC